MAVGGLTRREFLVALGGLAAACRRSGTPQAIQGEIVGGSHVRGHRLRDSPPARPERFEPRRVVIVGGGIAGLTAAWTLAHAGVDDFTVLELEPAPGGTSRAGSGSVCPYPWGAHYVPVPTTSNGPLFQLMDEVGAIDGRDAAGRPRWSEEVLCREPVERLFYRGEWHEGLYPRVGASREDLAELERFEDEMRGHARFRDASGRRGFALPRATASDAPELKALDRQSMAEYLAHNGYRSERLRWWIEYGMRDDYGATLAQVSAWAGVHYFAARRDDQGGEAAEYLTWPDGNGRLVSHLARTIGDRLKVDALVLDVVPEASGATVTYVDARTGETRGLRAGHVVFALPRFLAQRVIAPWRTSPPAFLASFHYGAWLVANLTLRDRPSDRGFSLAWDNVPYGGRGLGYVVATHQLGLDHGPTVFTYYRPFHDDDPRRDRERLLAAPWESLIEEVFADLRPAHPELRELTERADLYLWGHAMVRPSPGFLWSDDLAEAARPLGDIHFAHTDLSGVALFEEAQYHGVRAASAILARLGHRLPAWAG